MKKIYAIKTNDGFYILDTKNSYSGSDLINLFFDGVLPENTFHKNWVLIKKEPKKIEKEVSQPNINYRYVLTDKSLKSDKIKEVFKREDVSLKDGYDWIWKDEYSKYQSLYELKYDKQPNIKEKIDFEFILLMELEKIKEHKSFTFKTYGKWNKEDKVNSDNIENQLIDKIVFPDIILKDKPCKYSKKQTFDIIRAFVKDNIDSKYADITSDYSFCFTVKKKIPLFEHQKYTVDVNNNIFSKRKIKPKYVERWNKSRHIECFEMAPKPYQNYTVVKEFQGKNQTDIKNNIDLYLNDLIEFINKPLIDCPHCNGSGVIIDKP